jgi:hypothetical protein
MELYKHHFDSDKYTVSYVVYKDDDHSYKLSVSERWSIKDKLIKAEIAEDHLYIRFKDLDGKYRYIPLVTLPDGRPKSFEQLSKIGNHPKSYIDRKYVDILRYRFLGKSWRFTNDDVKLFDERDGQFLIEFKILTLNVKDTKKTKKQKNRNYEYLAVAIALNKDTTRVFGKNAWCNTFKGEKSSYVDTAKWMISIYLGESLHTYFPKICRPSMRIRFIDWYD